MSEELNLSPQAQLVLGILAKHGELMPSDFMAKYRANFADLQPIGYEWLDGEKGVSGPPTKAVILFDNGLKETDAAGLTDTTRDANLTKRICLTPEGKALVEAHRG